MSSPVASISVSLRNILLPTDFSSFSETALAYGIGLSKRYDSTLYTVTVVPEEITDYVQPPDPFYLRHSAEKKMADLARSEHIQGVRHRELVKEGFVSDVLSDLINRLEIDLLVLGTHEGYCDQSLLSSVDANAVAAVQRQRNALACEAQDESCNGSVSLENNPFQTGASDLRSSVLK